MNIRPATSEDAETIHQFICELADYEREPDAVDVTPAVLADQLRSDPAPFECLIAEDSAGEALGFAVFFQSYSTWRGRPGLYLEDLFVPERHRRRGVGLALLQQLAVICREREYKRLEWAVLNWNQPAIDFYVKLGAQPMDEWTTFRLDGAALAALGDEGPARPVN